MIIAALLLGWLLTSVTAAFLVGPLLKDNT